MTFQTANYNKCFKTVLLSQQYLPYTAENQSPHTSSLMAASNRPPSQGGTLVSRLSSYQENSSSKFLNICINSQTMGVFWHSYQLSSTNSEILQLLIFQHREAELVPFLLWPFLTPSATSQQTLISRVRTDNRTKEKLAVKYLFKHTKCLHANKSLNYARSKTEQKSLFIPTGNSLFNLSFHVFCRANELQEFPRKLSRLSPLKHHTHIQQLENAQYRTIPTCLALL